VAALLLQSVASPSWENSSVIKIVNEWCRHCPDWNQTSTRSSSTKAQSTSGRPHKKLDVTLNGHSRVRFEKDGHVGDYIHVLDDVGKDRKPRIMEKIAAEKRE